MFDDAWKGFKCQDCSKDEKYMRHCGLPEYKGDKSPTPPVFRIHFGKKIIRECPVSYCDWTNVGDAVDCHSWYEAGFLPEVWDETLNRPCSIYDQTEFFHLAHSSVAKMKNALEKKHMDKMKQKSNMK